MSRAISWFANNPVAANLVMILIVMGGITSLPSIQQRSFPEIEIEVVSIAVPYLGAAPEEVERGVCVRIEEEIFSITGIDRVTSSSSEGACGVSAELVKNYPIDRAVSEIKNAVDGITTFPVETEKPIIQHYQFKRNAMQIALSGDASERALKLYGEQIRDEIAALPGVTQVELANARAYEMSIEVPEESLRKHGLTFDQVVQAVRSSSLDMPGGTIKAEGGEILLRAMGQAYRAEEFEHIVVLTREDGTRLMLGEVAHIIDGFEEDERSARFDSQPAVLIKVFRVGDQKILELVETVRNYLPQARANLPDGLSLNVWRDESQYLRDRLNVLVSNGTFGFILVFCVLALFLKLRLAFWVAIGVPISILGALALFPVIPLAIDVLTLFAFILVLGLLVDDAIVIGENVHTHQENSVDPLEAAIQGAREVSVPVIFGVLTTVAAFFPLVFAEGTMGTFFGAIGVTAICCLGFSLVESLWILPSHLGHHVKVQEKTPPQGSLQARWKQLQSAAATLLTRIAKRQYRPALEKVIEYRYTAASVAVVCLMLTFTVISAGYMNFVFFDQIESDTVTASVTMPPGTPVEVTADAVRELEVAAEQIREELDERFAHLGYPMIHHIMAAVGGRAASRSGPPSGGGSNSSNYGEVAIEMAGGNFRKMTGADVVARWRELTPPISGADELVFSADYMNTGDPIDVELRSANVDTLTRAAEQVKRQLATYPGVFDISDSFQEGKSEIQLTILPSAEPLGLTLEDLAQQVRQAFYGAEAQRIQRGRDDIRVMVRYPEANRRSLGDLDNLRIRTPNGGEVPFYVVARAEPGRGFSTIKRSDRQRVLNVTADVDPTMGNANQIVAELLRGFLPELAKDHPGLAYGFSGQQREQQKTMIGMVRDTVLALILIFALLAVPLRSYFQPLLIMSVIPFGVVGAVAGHLIMGINMSMMSVFGIVALTGVVVNSSLVLVHYINRRREMGDPLVRAVRDAGVARFRPIVLTTMTTFSGLTPLLLEQSMGAKFLIPMATSLAFGVLFATSISLFLLPAGYVILDDLQGLVRRVRAGKPDHEEPAAPSPVRDIAEARTLAG
jgi:multidrug efflux pump subunit AcrB